jgi:indole-3-glycerol phosphate synthase
MILDDIFEERKLQLSREKARCKNDLDFKKSLTERHIIAEVKKASPSKSVIAEDFYPVETALMYEQYGASAISVLTEEKYFQGSSLYLSQIREKVNIPLLRKDFIFDEFQIAEAAVLGANAVLLIAAMLSAERFGELYVFAE